MLFKYPSLLKRHLANQRPCNALVASSVAPTQTPKQHLCSCGHGYAHRQGLYEHRKTCTALSPKGDIGALIDIVSQQQKQIAALSALPTAPHVSLSVTDNHAVTHNELHINHAPQIHIKVNTHGKEDTSHLKEKLGLLLDTMAPGVDGKVVIAKVLGLIYNDPTCPQNMTAYISNKRDNIPHVRTPDGWEPRTEAEVYPAMVIRACSELELKQDFELGYTPEGLIQLEARSRHVRAAFDAEPDVKVPKEAAQFLRPMLQSNKGHLLHEQVPALGNGDHWADRSETPSPARTKHPLPPARKQ
jgi:hypothetical protein